MAETVVKSSQRFTYPPLHATLDSLRLLHLHPSTFPQEPVTCTLITTTFASKAKYSALSYCWGEGPASEFIKINGARFDVRPNLAVALRKLRLTDSELVLWVDAICINQDDVSERSSQVELMSFIYTRARIVLVWLGETEDRDANSMTSPTTSSQVEEMCVVPYWGRVWIVQEIVLAFDVRVCFESRTFGRADMPWETFAKEAEYVDEEVAELPLKLVKQRRLRHSDGSRLEVLIETYVNAECQEPRDKIYGFLGLAHDGSNGRLKVDYEKPISKLYEEVVLFQTQSRPVEWGLKSSIDRPMQLVRFSQLLQKSFEGAIGTDMKTFLDKNENRTPIVTARALIEGSILYLGPSYSEMVGSAQATRDWKQVIETEYESPDDVRLVRETDDRYTNYLIQMEDSELEHVCDISILNYNSTTPFTSHATPVNESWKGDPVRGDSITTFDSWLKEPVTSWIIAYPTTCPDEPRRFLGTNTFMGLAPPGAQEGDFICRFHECDVAAVLRRHGDDAWFDIVGRADCASAWNREDFKYKRIEARGGFDGAGVVNIKLDIATLQMLTS